MEQCDPGRRNSAKAREFWNVIEFCVIGFHFLILRVESTSSKRIRELSQKLNLGRDQISGVGDGGTSGVGTGVDSGGGTGVGSGVGTGVGSGSASGGLLLFGQSF